jgi:RNA polymerase sigma factor (sigma-70 family)
VLSERSPARGGTSSSDGGDDFGALLAGARAGVPEAWNRIYGTLAPAVAGYLRVQGASEVDDLCSEVFLGVFRGIVSFTGDAAAFRSWVFVIAHHRLADERRRRARRPSMAPFPESAPRSTVGSAEDDALREIATARVHATCRQLAPDQRDVVLLRIIGELTVEEVARVLGKTPGAVKQLQRRGFEAIRRISAREGVPL